MTSDIFLRVTSATSNDSIFELSNEQELIRNEKRATSEFATSNEQRVKSDFITSKEQQVNSNK